MKRLFGIRGWLPAAVSLMMIIASFAACGGRGDTPADATTGQPNLEAALIELEQLPVPVEVDGGDFAELKRELARVLRERWPERVASRVPGPNSFPHTNLRYAEEDGQALLIWNCFFTGDYDLNGYVGIADLTPLGIYLNSTESDPDFPFWVDGDNNGIISLSDITPLGTNFGNNVIAYEVQGTHTPQIAESWEMVARVDRWNRSGNELSYAIPDPCGGMQFRIVPLGWDNEKSVAIYPGNGIIEIIEEVEIPQTGSITGTVVDGISLEPMMATVSVEGRDSILTAPDGRFSFSNLPVTDRLAVQVSADAYRDSTAVYAVVGGTTRDQQIGLLTRAPAQLIDADAGGFVLGTAQSSLQLPAGGLVDGDGIALGGNVSVQFSYLNPTDPVQLAAAPGDFCARQLDESIAMLESFGMVEVFIDDGSGAGADLAPGATAPITVPIQAGQQAEAPETMPLYSFDEESGMWIEEGILTKDPGGVSYSGELTHFSTWNCDRPLITTCIELLVLDNAQNAVQGAYVEVVGLDYTGSSSGYTDETGRVHVPCRLDSSVQITATFGLNIGTAQLQTPAQQMLCSDEEHGIFVGGITLDGEIQWPPQAALTASAYSGEAPLSVDFDAAGSSDPNGDIVSYEIDYDGQSGPLGWQTLTELQFSHTYTGTGHFLPVLRVTDAEGQISTVTILICVQ